MIAIVPARGGSKGLPGKNTRILCGKPLISWTIETALKSKYIDKVVLSTDDDKIAEIGEDCGAIIPFMRPSELAGDNSIATDAYLYTIERLNKENGYIIEDFMVLLPTAPMRLVEDIDQAVEIFYNNKASSVMSYASLNHPPEWTVKILDDGIVRNYFTCLSEGKNRQEYCSPYICNGSIYILKYSLFKESKKYYYPNTYGYIMPQQRSIDIDTEIDFKFAEFLMRNDERYK